MFRSKWVPLAAVALLSGSVLVFADDATTPPAAEKHHRATKLTKPWSELSGLTDEQKTKILEIHGKANEEIKAIHDKEKTDIMALLTDEEKNQAEQLESKTPAKSAPETQPAAK